MAPPTPDENLLSTLWAMDRSMLQAHRDATEESRAQAEKTAETLLEYPELPLLIRARALMVLGCSDKPGFLDHAKEAVRIAQLGIDISSEKTKLQQELLESCQHVLKEAQEAHDEGEEEATDEAAESGVEGSDGSGEDRNQEMIIVWENGKAINVRDREAEERAKAAAESTEAGDQELVEKSDTVTSQTEVPAGKKIKRRRIDRASAGKEDKYEHYDKAVEAWVGAGTAVDPMLVDEGEEDEILTG